MTGFGRAQATLPDGTEASVVVRGVNHRFLDVAMKLRDEWAAMEPVFRRAVADVAARGHVDLVVRTTRPLGRAATFDEEAAARYASLWSEAATRGSLPGTLTARDLLGLPGVVRVDDSSEPDDAGRDALLAVVKSALEEFDASKKREGESLLAALSDRLQRMEAGIGKLDAERQGLSERVNALLRERIKKLLAEFPLDDARIAQEAAMLADRADVSEEVERFKTHLVEIRRLLDSGGPVGKRLDFLAQELHRETNTSGQKVRETGALKHVLDLKSEVEAFKEQVQNVE
jgi:uncharacterized protein (TIGR00255 family)